MFSLAGKIRDAVGVIGNAWPHQPRAGIILGTGLGEFAEHVDVEATIDYAQIPHFPRSTADGHRGRLVTGRLAGLRVIVMQGRHHAYEGYSPAETTLPVRVINAMGAELLILSNAAGGMNPRHAAGDVVVIDDHINMMAANPLIGINDDSLAPRFPDMCRPYDPVLVGIAMDVARRERLPAHRGVYVGVPGPNLETRAEYRLFRFIGGDIVGMSTVPEAIVAAHAGLRVLALSTVTNVCLPESLRPVDIAEILSTASAAEPRVRKIVTGVLAEFGDGTERVPRIS